MDMHSLVYLFSFWMACRATYNLQTKIYI